MASVFQKAGDTLRGKPTNTSNQEDGASLTAILETVQDRGAFTLLICDITELMRTRLLGIFDPDEGGQSKETDETSTSANTNQQETLERQKAELAKREKELNEETTVELKNAALDFFDDWRDSVILRVGEAVNSRKAAKEQSPALQAGDFYVG